MVAEKLFRPLLFDVDLVDFFLCARKSFRAIFRAVFQHAGRKTHLRINVSQMIKTSFICDFNYLRHKNYYAVKKCMQIEARGWLRLYETWKKNELK